MTRYGPETVSELDRWRYLLAAPLLGLAALCALGYGISVAAAEKIGGL